MTLECPGVVAGALDRWSECRSQEAILAVGRCTVSIVLGLDVVAASIPENTLEGRARNVRPHRVSLTLNGEIHGAQGGSRSGMERGLGVQAQEGTGNAGMVQGRGLSHGSRLLEVRIPSPRQRVLDRHKGIGRVG